MLIFKGCDKWVDICLYDMENHFSFTITEPSGLWNARIPKLEKWASPFVFLEVSWFICSFIQQIYFLNTSHVPDEVLGAMGIWGIMTDEVFPFIEFVPRKETDNK